MAESPNEKQRIGTALFATRAELNMLFLLVRQNLDIRRYLWESGKKHIWSWMTVAGIIGWILSRLPTRKQEIYIRSTDPIKSEKRLGGGGILRPVLEWRVGNYKAASRRLFHKEDCGNSEVPGRKFYRRCYQMGGCIFKRD